jgi:hypothetical protein
MTRGYRLRNSKVDANQREIVSALNDLPDVRAISIGEPLDLLVGYGCENFLIEIKNPHGKDRRGPSWESQKKFIESWPGSADVCCTLDEVLNVIEYTR